MPAQLVDVEPVRGRTAPSLPIVACSVMLFTSGPSTVSHFKWHTKCKGLEGVFLGGGLRKF